MNLVHPCVDPVSPTPVPLTIVTGDAGVATVVDRISTGGELFVAPPSVLEDLPRHRHLSGVAITADIAPRTPGCRCCEVRLDVVEALVRVVRRRQPPHRLVLAVPGAEDVVTVVRTVLSDPDLARLVTLDGVVATVDARAAATRLAVGAPIGDQTMVDRVAIADRIVPIGSDALTRAARIEVFRSLDGIAAFAQSAEPIERIRPLQLLGLRAWHGVPDTPAGTACAVLPARTAASDVELPTIVVLQQQGMLDPDAVDDWLAGIVAGHAPRLLRLQGVLAVDGAPVRIGCHAVRSHLSIHPEPPGIADGPPCTRVVISGAGLDPGELLTGLHAARRP